MTQRLILSTHARGRAQVRAHGVDLRRWLIPALAQLEAAIGPRERVAWLDAPGDLVPVFERSSRSGPLVLVTVLPRGGRPSRGTRGLRLRDQGA